MKTPDGYEIVYPAKVSIFNAMRGKTVAGIDLGTSRALRLGVGSMAIQIARLLKARVISTVGTERQNRKSRQAIHRGGNGNRIMPRRTVTQRATPGREKGQPEHSVHHPSGRGVDVVIEHIGQAVWDQCLRSLARGGRLVTCGATSGPENLLDARYVYSRQLTIKGSYMGTRAELLEASRFIEAGNVRPVVDSVFRLVRQGARSKLSGARTDARVLRTMFGKIILVQ